MDREKARLCHTPGSDLLLLQGLPEKLAWLQAACLPPEAAGAKGRQVLMRNRYGEIAWSRPLLAWSGAQARLCPGPHPGLEVVLLAQ